MSLIRSLLFVRRCPYCGEILTDSLPECEHCRRLFTDQIHYRQLPAGTRCLAPFLYEEPYRNSVLSMKDVAVSTNTESFALQMVRVLHDISLTPDVITAVPLYWHNKWRRGYNQSEKIARCVGRLIDCPYRELLKKVRKNKVQHYLNPEQRSANVIGVYACRDGGSLEGKTVLLIDDVCTTGSTIEECARILRKDGHAANVIAMTAVMVSSSAVHPQADFPEQVRQWLTSLNNT